MNVAATGGENAINSNSAVPDSNTLLAYKLLKDSWSDNKVFDDLLREEMKYLVTGISLLQNDPYLQLKMGGVTLNNAGVLANTIKSKVSELDIRKRIEPTADALLQHEYGKPTLRELAPGRRDAVSAKTTGGADDPRVSMDILAGTWRNTGVRVPTLGQGGDRRPNIYPGNNSEYRGHGIFFSRPAADGGANRM